MERQKESSCIYIPVNTNLIYEKHIHQMMDLCLYDMTIYWIVEILMFIIVSQTSKSRRNMILNPDWLKPKEKPYFHQISMDCLEKLVECME